MKRVVLALIRFYQKALRNPLHLGGVIILGGSIGCRFEPSCSEYLYRAVSKYGLKQGLLKGSRRIIRCHPWSPGGWDPLP